ncbi:SprT family protein [Alkalicoccus urumqiensis]|uniref:Protein SprT-like n=1 Tax=Alkalicoccus urumqiensis TaxID=1548213 RepID=A0A2P6MIM2_ALKUR|nr:SprT family protein [Alkalicoccus urumqiensis]PRO66098.1 SprT family protein [Alkalicoccus urumqiensis]
MRNDELQKLTEELSERYFNKAFQHEAFFNHRLRTTGGRYALETHHIEINPKHLEYYGMDELIGIIKHELCHYHLHLEGRGYQHRDADFRRLLQKVGGSRHCQTLPGARRKSRTVHLYSCLSCSQEYPRRRRMNTDKYVCGRCGGRLEKLDEKKIGKSLTSFSSL